MKISVLVAQYFYQNRVLNLPGIGSFYLDDVVDVQSIADKNSRDLLEHIHFAQKNIIRPDDDLIDFIRKHTGKIKPLAESDLETFVSDGKLMLNIGKPFHIEGIGTLQKNKEGTYEFTPGQPVVQRLETVSMTEREPEVVKKRSVFDENSYETKNNSTRRLALGLGVLVGLGVILWGGYSLYHSKVEPDTTTIITHTNNTNPADTTKQTSQYMHNIDSPQQALQEVLKKDSTHFNQARAETTKTVTPAPPTPTTNATTATASGPSKIYTFVLETTTFKTTALKRYANLKPKVDLKTNADSSFFKIVISLKGTPGDTTRLKDSLHNWYWGPKNRVITIEQ